MPEIYRIRMELRLNGRVSTYHWLRATYGARRLTAMWMIYVAVQETAHRDRNPILGS